MNIQRLQALLSVESPFQTQNQVEQPQGAPAFSDVLSQAMARVEQDQVAATDAALKLAAGETDDIAQVMIISERANLSLGLAVQVRNKLLEAYQEIMRMPL